MYLKVLQILSCLPRVSDGSPLWRFHSRLYRSHVKALSQGSERDHPVIYICNPIPSLQLRWRTDEHRIMAPVSGAICVLAANVIFENFQPEIIFMFTWKCPSRGRKSDATLSVYHYSVSVVIVTGDCRGGDWKAWRFWHHDQTQFVIYGAGRLKDSKHCRYKIILINLSLQHLTFARYTTSNEYC